MAEQQKIATVAEAEAIDLGEFSELLEKDFKVKKDDSEKLQQLVRNLALAAQSRSETTTISSNAIKSIKSLIAGIDKMLTAQVNEILHAPEVREMEGTWRGLWYLDQQHRNGSEAEDPGDEHLQGGSWPTRSKTMKARCGTRARSSRRSTRTSIRCSAASRSAA